jgi:hypothetical protein
MCAYRLQDLSGTTLADLMATHPYVILNGEIRENKFFVPPEQYIAELLSKRTMEAPPID